MEDNVIECGGFRAALDETDGVGCVSVECRGDGWSVRLPFGSCGYRLLSYCIGTGDSEAALNVCRYLRLVCEFLEAGFMAGVIGMMDGYGPGVADGAHSGSSPTALM